MESKFVARRVFYNPIYRDKATVLKSYDDTGGLYTLGELEVAPGGGNTLHIHTAFEETFTVVRGELGVVLQNRLYILRPGESITVPKNTPHHFVNKSNESIICHVKFVPGHEDFFKGLAIGYGLASDGKTNSKGVPKKLSHLAMLMVLTDTKPAGLLMHTFPLFKWLAAKVRKNGTQQLLLEKYYYQKVR
ncbi:MAG TPA: cupin domain-containing protein [Flavitalea sp.]|nr:cupin domain-containing protein [Flavitalea sp.]